MRPGQRPWPASLSQSHLLVGLPRTTRVSVKKSAPSQNSYKVEPDRRFTTIPSNRQLTRSRLNLTRGDGEDLVRMVKSHPENDDLTKEADLFRGRLPQDRNLRLQLLARLLWSELKWFRGHARQRRCRRSDQDKATPMTDTASASYQQAPRHILSLSGGKDSAALAI